MKALVARLGLEERFFISKRAGIFILTIASAFVVLNLWSLVSGNSTFNDNVGLVLATGMVLFASADFLHYRHEYLALSLRVFASLMSVVALAALVLRAASVIGLS